MPRDIDYYGLLGVARDASEAEIRERFRALAREAHPDRAPAGRKAEAEAKFQDLTEAVNVLTSPDRRKSYDFDLAASKGVSADADAIAQNYLGQGIAAYKERKFTEAAGNFQIVVGRNPRDVKAQHYLGLASARAGDVRTAVKAIEAALTIELSGERADEVTVRWPSGLVQTTRDDGVLSPLRRELGRGVAAAEPHLGAAVVS